MEALRELSRKPDSRPVYEYELPPELADKDDYVKKSVGLVKLKMSEEVDASSGVTNKAKLAYQLLRKALVEIDGRRLDKANGEDETVLEHCLPEIRDLMLEAYGDMSTLPDAVTKKFLASRKVKV